MKKANPRKRRNTPTGRDSLDGIQFAEARAQVEGQKADGIREAMANLSSLPSDRELMVKIAEAQQARETRIVYDAVYDARETQRAWRELLRKAELDKPVAPPKHARFAIFLLPRAYQRIIFGDLEEQLPIWIEECGRRKAAFLYWWQFLISTAIVAWPRTRRWRYIALGILLLSSAAEHHVSSGTLWTSLWQRVLAYF